MNKFLSALDTSVADAPLRPLLYTAGAAATAAGIYYYVKRDGKTTTSDSEVTTEDPVCDWATEPALLQPMEVPLDQVTNAVTEAEEKIQKLVMSNTQLEERVRELEELLCEARRDGMKSKASQAEAEEKHQKAEETITQLEEEKSDLTKQGCERDQEADSILQVENKKMKKTLMDKEELLKVFLIEAEEKHQKALETIAQLEVDKSDLTKQLETLQDMWILLGEAHRECDKLKAEETMLSQLEVVKSDQKDQVSHGIVQNMEHLLTAFILILFFLSLFIIRTKCLSSTT
ncbi:putative golgin subfamily A member 6-like protein 3 isoform X2 [Ictalurus punctatus]|uniref:Golgin subfamily A member 6-like protein 3 isoform X2 n=1 Tax=Ictalurus punctatus TaxID=7998 RepID=A0A2D0SQ88_ICTPU|nr:putative golgin subfamily A member 6-like protein 3 isoform X2 [Ictalurus punctatus]